MAFCVNNYFTKGQTSYQSTHGDIKISTDIISALDVSAV